MSGGDERRPPAWWTWLRDQYGRAGEATSGPRAFAGVAEAIGIVIAEHPVDARPWRGVMRYHCSTCCDSRCFEVPDGWGSPTPGHVAEVPDCCATLRALSLPWVEQGGAPQPLVDALAGGDWLRWSVP